MNSQHPPDQVLDEARRGLQDLMTRSGLSRETFLGFLTTNPNADPSQLPPQLDPGLSPIIKEEASGEGMLLQRRAKLRKMQNKLCGTA
jgi:hypothetical protein